TALAGAGALGTIALAAIALAGTLGRIALVAVALAAVLAVALAVGVVLALAGVLGPVALAGTLGGAFFTCLAALVATLAALVAAHRLGDALGALGGVALGLGQRVGIDLAAVVLGPDQFLIAENLVQLLEQVGEPFHLLLALGGQTVAQEQGDHGPQVLG